MAVPGPKIPVRADHRFLQKLYQSLMGGKVEQVPEEFDFISRVFSQAGGSWVRLFRGSPGDIDLLKRVVKRAFKAGKLTKKFNWGA